MRSLVVKRKQAAIVLDDVCLVVSLLWSLITQLTRNSLLSIELFLQATSDNTANIEGYRFSNTLNNCDMSNRGLSVTFDSSHGATTVMCEEEQLTVSLFAPLKAETS